MRPEAEEAMNTLTADVVAAGERGSRGPGGGGLEDVLGGDQLLWWWKVAGFGDFGVWFRCVC